MKCNVLIKRAGALTVEANSLDWFFTRRAMAENVTRRGAPKEIRL